MQFPLNIHTRCGPLLALALFYLVGMFMGLFCIAVPVWIIFVRPDNPVVYQILIILPAGLYLLFFSPLIIWTAMSDAANPAPVIRISGSEIKDCRIGLEATWDGISSTKRTYYKGSVKGIRLTFYHSVNLKNYSFRIGSWMLPWRRRPNEAYIPLIFLDTPAAVLADAIEAIVADRGCKPRS